MPQIPDSLAPKPKQPSSEVQWQTISYRTVGLLLVALISVAGGVLWYLFPDFVKGLLPKSKPPQAAVLIQQQARFQNLDGTVRVKKSSAVLWEAASQNTTLEKGDVVQTGPDGLARILFADETTYSMRGDTLIVIEDNGTHQQDKSTRVAVKVNSGTVDLATAKFRGESQVRFSDAVADVRQDSRAMVKNNPNDNVAELLVTQGSSQVSSGAAKVELGQYEKATLSGTGDRARLTKERAMGPPLQISPPNLTPLIVSDVRTYILNVAWTAVPGAARYRLKIAPHSSLSKAVYDKTVTGTSVKVSGLAEGTYYWAVSSVDAGGKESETSDTSRFIVVREQNEKNEIMLVIDDMIRQGRSYVIVGRTEPSARVMVNDEPVFNVSPDGSFKHYTMPFKAGAGQITVTAQNARGMIATQRKSFFIEE